MTQIIGKSLDEFTSTIVFGLCFFFSLTTGVIVSDLQVNNQNLLELNDRCVVIESTDNPPRINPLCMPELDQLFQDEPVWKYDRVPVYGGVGIHDYFDYSSSLLNRGRVLRFSVEDFLDKDVPTWNKCSTIDILKEKT